ncbi:MAG: hypothetical protein FJY80_09905 [Candidatus Aminicenantes bacterium]|nr:hypothetical protein [Candidatus Aminicenantes bacterium]
MVELVFLIISVGSISVVSRQRGGNPLLWGPLALAGYFLLKLGMRKFNLFPLPPGQEGDFNLVRSIISVGFVCLVYLFVRFGLGRTKAKAGGKWVCPDCKYLNDEIATNCEACGKAYQESE